MKFYFLTAILMTGFCGAVSAQDDQTSLCPTISVSGGGRVQAAQPIVFTANITNRDTKNLVYERSIDNGTIISGQKTPVIEVDLTGTRSRKVTATVTVKGLPENCPDSASQTGSTAPLSCDPINFAEYEKISPREERSKLAALARELEKNKALTAYFILYTTNEKSSRALESRSANISKYLTETQKISKERFQIVYGGKTGAYRTRIYLGAPCD